MNINKKAVVVCGIICLAIVAIASYPYLRLAGSASSEFDLEAAQLRAVHSGTNANWFAAQGTFDEAGNQLEEEWFIDNSGVWYYLLPSRDLYQWKTKADRTGDQKITTLSEREAYSLFRNHDDFREKFGLHRLRDVEYFNWMEENASSATLHEKWVRGVHPDYVGEQWFYITKNGNLYLSYAGKHEFIATLPLAYYKNPYMLEGWCPSESMYEQAITAWRAHKDYVTNNIQLPEGTSSERYNSDVIYNAQQEIGNLLEMSYMCGDRELFEELLDIMLIPLGALTNDTKWLGVSGNNYTEVHLNSVQWLYPVTRSLAIIAELRPAERSKAMTNFVENYRDVARIHIERFIKSENHFPTSPGWGCFTIPEGVPTTREARDTKQWKRMAYFNKNHYEYLDMLLKKEVGDVPDFCNSITDLDTWIMADAAEFLAAHYHDSALIPLDASLKNALQNYVSRSVHVLQNRTEHLWYKVGDEYVDAINFDIQDRQNILSLHWYTDSEPPWERIERDPWFQKHIEAADRSSAAGWDFGHAARLTHVLRTFSRHRDVSGVNFPSHRDMKWFTNQLMYSVFNRDWEWPLFSNYLDGHNGWYRVGYLGRNKFGFAPSDLSSSFPWGYGFLAVHDKDIVRVIQRMYDIVTSETQEEIDFWKNHYGASYQNGVRSNKKTYLPDSYEMLYWLPAMIVPQE